MVCNINRSITIGVLTTLVMTLIIFIWIGPENMRTMNMTTGNLLLLMATLFVISVAIDVFNQCYTVCDSLISSISYGLFTVALIYLFFSIFIRQIDFTSQTVIAFIINVLLLAALHGLTCKSIHKIGMQKQILYVYRD